MDKVNFTKHRLNKKTLQYYMGKEVVQSYKRKDTRVRLANLIGEVLQEDDYQFDWNGWYRKCNIPVSNLK